MSDTIQEQQPAPDFTLPAVGDDNIVKNGQVHLADLKGHSVVLYFYPKDDTPGCTKEACAFRDSYEDFKDAGAEVIGVSSDSPESHQQFIAKYHLPFTLVSDSDGALRRLYGVQNVTTEKYGVLPGRVTYVIDKEGIVRLVFSSLFEAERHITEAITILKAADK